MAFLEDQLKIRLGLLEDITKQANEQKILSGQLLTDSQQEAAIAAEKLKDLRQLNAIMVGNTDQQTAALQTQIKRLRMLERSGWGITEAQKSQLKLYEQIAGTIDETTRKEMVAHAQQQQRINEHIQRSLSLAQQYQSSWAQALGMSTRGYEGLVGNIVLGTKQLGSFTEALRRQAEALAKEATNIWSPMNVLNTVLENTRDFAIALDQSTSEFVSATGASRDYGEQIQAVALDTTQFGADVRAVGQAYVGLYNSFTSFSQLSKEQQQSLGRTGALLQKVGIDARTFGETMNSLTKGLGMSLGQAETTVRSFAEEAAQLGIAPGTMARNFIQLMPQLAAFGSQAPAVFRRAAQTAKALGLEMREMLRVTNQFDEFDRAAEAVGGLNAILGGTYLDTVSMVLTTDPTERIIMLKKAFDAAGESVQTMEYYQLKALATQSGFGENVNAFRQAMSQSTVELRRQNVEQLRLQELASAATNVMDKVRNTFYAFMVQVEPVIDMVRSLVEGFMALTRTPIVGDLIKVVGTFGLVTAAATKLVSMIYAIKTAYTALSLTTGTLRGNTVLAMMAFTAVYTIITKLKGPLRALALTLVGVAIAVGLLRAAQTAGASLLGTAAAVAGMGAVGGAMYASIKKAHTGVDNTKGSYLVKKDEMIVSPQQGSAILNNKNTDAILAAAEKGSSGGGLDNKNAAKIVNELRAVATIMKESTVPKSADGGGSFVATVPVVLNINDTEVARVVEKVWLRQSELA